MLFSVFSDTVLSSKHQKESGNDVFHLLHCIKDEYQFVSTYLFIVQI